MFSFLFCSNFCNEDLHFSILTENNFFKRMISKGCLLVRSDLSFVKNAVSSGEISEIIEQCYS